LFRRSRHFSQRLRQAALEDEIGELTSLDQEVIESLQQHEVLTENIEKQFERKLTFGEHLSDKIAEFGGSWKFIITFGGVIVVWVVLNAVLLLDRGFDPYPFILLNLILSCLAALQAPVIMMSQKPGGSARSVTGGKRLQGQSQSRARDSAPARETRSPAAAAIQSPFRNPADPDRTAGRNQPEKARLNSRAADTAG
jgi:Predicted membrane protein